MRPRRPATTPAALPPVEAQVTGPSQAPEGEGGSVLRGIGLMVLAMLLIPVMDGLAKHLTQSFPTLQVVWARYFFHLAFLLPLLLWRYGPRGFAPARPWLQIARGGLLLGSTSLFFGAIATIPLADAIALVFISPLIVTALSGLLLGEAVGPRRWTAVVIGFAGALIVIRPGLMEVGPGSLLALGAGTVYALYIVMTRKLAGSAPPLVTLAFTALLGACVTSALVWAVWVRPDPLALTLMAAMGLIAAAGHLLIIRAFELAPASLLAPYGYTEIVMATLVGFVAFGDLPDGWTWVGMAVITASGLYISLRERRGAKNR